MVSASLYCLWLSDKSLINKQKFHFALFCIIFIYPLYLANVSEVTDFDGVLPKQILQLSNIFAIDFKHNKHFSQPFWHATAGEAQV